MEVSCSKRLSKKDVKKSIHIIWLFFFLLSGCEGFKQEPICPNDSMPGPGLFSGPEGGFLIPLPDSWKDSPSKEKTDCEDKNKKTDTKEKN